MADFFYFFILHGGSGIDLVLSPDLLRLKLSRPGIKMFVGRGKSGSVTVVKNIKHV